MIDLQKLDDTIALMVGLTTRNPDLVCGYSDPLATIFVDFIIILVIASVIFLAVTTARIVYKLIKKLYGRFV